MMEELTGKAKLEEKKRHMTKDEKEILELYRKAKKANLEFLGRMNLKNQEELRAAVIRKGIENCPFRKYCQEGEHKDVNP